MTVNHKATVEMKAIVVSIVNVDCMHPLLELFVGDDFAHILEDELSRFKLVAAPDSPSFFFGHKTFQSLGPAMPLNTLVLALITHTAELPAALGIDHLIQTVLTTTLGYINFT